MGLSGKIGALSIALVLVLVLAVASAAAAKSSKKAQRTHVTSQVTLQAVGPDGVSGRVSGSQKACRSQRQVTVYRVNSGPSVPSSEFVASTWTHGDGSWDVPGPMFPSEFYAVIGPKKAKQIVCSAATSNSLLWG
jgi:hypothetical protein